MEFPQEPGGGREGNQRKRSSLVVECPPYPLPSIFLFPTGPNSIQFRAAPRSIIDPSIPLPRVSRIIPRFENVPLPPSFRIIDDPTIRERAPVFQGRGREIGREIRQAEGESHPIKITSPFEFVKQGGGGGRLLAL